MKRLDQARHQSLRSVPSVLVSPFWVEPERIAPAAEPERIEPAAADPERTETADEPGRTEPVAELEQFGPVAALACTGTPTVPARTDAGLAAPAAEPGPGQTEAVAQLVARIETEELLERTGSESVLKPAAAKAENH